jgi:hypothetical protein
MGSNRIIGIRKSLVPRIFGTKKSRITVSRQGFFENTSMHSFTAQANLGLETVEIGRSAIDAQQMS